MTSAKLWQNFVQNWVTISQAGKKRIPTNILDFFVHNKPSEFYPNTLPPIPYPLYILKGPSYIYTLRDNYYMFISAKSEASQNQVSSLLYISGIYTLSIGIVDIRAMSVHILFWRGWNPVQVVMWKHSLQAPFKP